MNLEASMEHVPNDLNLFDITNFYEGGFDSFENKFELLTSLMLDLFSGTRQQLQAIQNRLELSTLQNNPGMSLKRHNYSITFAVLTVGAMLASTAYFVTSAIQSASERVMNTIDDQWKNNMPRNLGHNFEKLKYPEHSKKITRTDLKERTQKHYLKMRLAEKRRRP